MIEEYKFGSFKVMGRNYLDDIKIINNKPKSYSLKDYRKGLTLEDVRDITDARPKVVVIGNGASGMLVISKDVKDYLRSLGIQLLIDRTSEAVKAVNRLIEEKKNFAAFLKATS